MTKRKRPPHSTRVLSQWADAYARERGGGECPYSISYPRPTHRTQFTGLAFDQHGVFTTAQARELGIHPKSVAAMARRGRLRRLSFGVYQALGAPVTPWTEFMNASFWPQGVRGVLSHETALSIMELSGISSARLHLTIPSGHRIRRLRPQGLVLHRAGLPEEDIGLVEGVPVTKGARALRDCVRAHLGPALLRQTIDDGLRLGWLAAEEAEEINSEPFRRLGLGGRLGTSPLNPRGT